MNDPKVVVRAREIARRALDGELDPLLACRDLVTMGRGLPDIPSALWDVFLGVASEIDGLPIGDERQHWSKEALQAKDKEAARYRGQVQEELFQAFRELASVLGSSPKRVNPV